MSWELHFLAMKSRFMTKEENYNCHLSLFLLIIPQFPSWTLSLSCVFFFLSCLKAVKTQRGVRKLTWREGVVISVCILWVFMNFPVELHKHRSRWPAAWVGWEQEPDCQGTYADRLCGITLKTLVLSALTRRWEKSKRERSGRCSVSSGVQRKKFIEKSAGGNAVMKF